MADVITIEPERSNHIAKLTYDPGTQTLRVRFTNDYVYTYADVPPSVFATMTRQQSMGQYFHHVIKRHYLLVGKYKAAAKQAEPAPAAETEIEE